MARYRLRHFTKFQRFAGCGRWHNGSNEGWIVVKVNDGTAHYSGLQTCASVWACPVCGAKIRQARADELEAAIAAWLEAGHGVEFVTLTVPHHAGMPLGGYDDQGEKVPGLFDLVADAWRIGVTSGRQFRGDREAFGIPAYCRTIEVTYGQHGWHPHIHALLFTDRPLDDAQRTALSSLMFARWSRYVQRAGFGTCSPDAFRMVGGALGAGQYLVKVQDEHDRSRRLGMELTRHDLKTGRSGSITPFELIAPASDGEAWALQLWHEWERATRGRRSLTWSQGGRAVLGLDEDEPTDEELADEDVGGVVVLVLTPRMWARVLAKPGLDALVLAVVETRGPVAALRLLAEFTPTAA